MQNVSNDTTNNTEKIDKGSNLQELGKVSTSQSFSSPIKSEFNTSYAEIFLSDTSESDDDDVSEVRTHNLDSLTLTSCRISYRPILLLLYLTLRRNKRLHVCPYLDSVSSDSLKLYSPQISLM